MNEEKKKKIGAIAWSDLTVNDAEGIRDFYTAVVGWQSESVDMGGYHDFNMNTPRSNRTVAGICHSRGINAQIPAQWLIYIFVENLDESARHCQELGGKIISASKGMGGLGRYCVIQDPAGAVAALFEAAE